jgi:hypothetical protein
VESRYTNGQPQNYDCPEKAWLKLVVEVTLDVDYASYLRELFLFVYGIKTA